MAQNYSAITIGLSGRYDLSAPFNTLINNQLSYTCVAIESIASLQIKGGDPFTDIYLPVKLSLQRFNYDDELGIPLYTLQSKNGEVLVIPGLNIIKLPDVNGVRYSNVMLGISLSALPDQQDLSSIKTEISDLIFNRVGVRSEVKSIVFGTSSIVSQQKHASLEIARKENVTNNKSNLSTLTDLKNQNAELLDRIQSLEKYISSL